MRLFIDEAGNTGSIADRNEILNYGTQRHFCLAAVVTQNAQEEAHLRHKYAMFKERFSPNGELKGNSLLTKAQNVALDFFIGKTWSRSARNCVRCIVIKTSGSKLR